MSSLLNELDDIRNSAVLDDVDGGVDMDETVDVPPPQPQEVRREQTREGGGGWEAQENSDREGEAKRDKKRYRSAKGERARERWRYPEGEIGGKRRERNRERTRAWVCVDGCGEEILGRKRPRERVILFGLRGLAVWTWLSAQKRRVG